MLLNEWVSLAIICILGAFSPGPSLMVILSLTAAHGRKVGYIASTGHGFGIFIYALLSATGLAVMLNNFKQLFVTIQIFGAIFLFYLGIRMIRLCFSTMEESETQNIFAENVPNRFIDGFLIAIFNPKIAVFFLSLFSQFVSPEQTFITQLGMATVAGTIDTGAYLTMVYFASTSLMIKFLSIFKKLVQMFFGFLLIILSIYLCLKLFMNVL